MNKIFELTVDEGKTSCSDCPFKPTIKLCKFFSSQDLCERYDFSKCNVSEKTDNVIKFGNEVRNDALQEQLSKYPSDALVTIECCNPDTMRYNKEDNTIRID